MLKNHAKFTAEISKGINIKESNVEVKLLIPLKAAQEHLVFLSSKQGEKINVFLGDPQMAWDFGEDEEDDVYRVYTGGRRVTADSSGVVTSIQRIDEQNDENQGDLFVQKEGEDGTKEEAEGDEVTEDNPGEEGAEEEGTQENADGEIDFESEEAGMGDKEPGAEESDGQEQEDVQPAESSVDQEQAAEESDQGAAPEEVDKEELEKFILEHRPAYDDLPIDFPGLLEERLNTNTTWREIANKVGLTSGQFSARWSKYKERVAQQMKDGGAA